MAHEDETLPAADEGPVQRTVRPRAWLREPKVQRHPGRHLVRGVTTIEPTAEDRQIAELDGDALVPLYGVAAIAAAVARERERCAKLCEDLDNDDNSGEYRMAAHWAAARIRGA